ncbi:hypothetical protein Tco_1443442, partial [Tanacetum coccineum]
DRGGGECGGDNEDMNECVMCQWVVVRIRVDEKYEESDDEEIEVLDEDEEINDGYDSVE